MPPDKSSWFKQTPILLYGMCCTVYVQDMCSEYVCSGIHTALRGEDKCF